MRYPMAALAAFFVSAFVSTASAEIFPVHDEAGVLVGYVDTAADDLTELLCIPGETKPFPYCVTFGDGGADGDDDGSDS